MTFQKMKVQLNQVDTWAELSRILLQWQDLRSLEVMVNHMMSVQIHNNT